MPAPARHSWVSVVVILLVFVVVPLWLVFRFLRWLLRVSYWSGYRAGLR